MLPGSSKSSHETFLYGTILHVSIVEIENAIKNLPPEKVNELMEWFVKYHAEIWDEQIADDLETGRLDPVLACVDSEIAAGKAKPL